MKKKKSEIDWIKILGIACKNGCSRREYKKLVELTYDKDVNPFSKTKIKKNQDGIPCDSKYIKLSQNFIKEIINKNYCEAQKLAKKILSLG